MSRPEKVSAAHLERLAVVYVRQSTLAQVRQHTESTQRQYALAAEAQRLGWPAARVEVIDDDLGLSGRSADGRSGFRELVGRVCVGEVGAILGLEVSRLARSSADLQRLLELWARLSSRLIKLLWAAMFTPRRSPFRTPSLRHEPGRCSG
jgi:DNA invertase Pin-like site-specific DNA recombinase